VNAAGGLRYDRYSFAGSDEWLMRVGPEGGIPVLIVPPLFEELNRTRALIAATMRALAQRGFCCTLPDLPGTGESPRPLEACGWNDWRGALAAAAGEPAHVVAIRGGCLIDDAVAARTHWRFAPVAGASLKRDLARAGLAGGADFAGYPIAPEMQAALEAAQPAAVEQVRTVRLASDPGEANAKLAGPALWRRSEPGTSIELAEAMADDIAGWVARCGG
jgi:pimeloyl-ACP methyl ester carboxylesterase